MMDALPERERQYYADEGNVVQGSLLPDQELEELTRRFGFVGGSYDQYVAYFLRDDIPGDMWHYDSVDQVRAIAGFSAVLKKDGHSQRKLLMSVPANAQWQEARGRNRLGLHGGGALGLLHVADTGWHVSAFDAENAFTRVATPCWMWPWFATPPILAADIWSRLPLELRRRVTPATPICPQYRRLPMGASHSVNILMTIGLAQAGRAFDCSRRLAEQVVAEGSRAHPLQAFLLELRSEAVRIPRRATLLVLEFGAGDGRACDLTDELRNAQAESVRCFCVKSDDVSLQNTTGFYESGPCQSQLTGALDPDDAEVQEALLDALDEGRLDGVAVIVWNDVLAATPKAIWRRRQWMIAQAFDRMEVAGGVTVAYLHLGVQDLWSGADLGDWACFCERVTMFDDTSGHWRTLAQLPGAAAARDALARLRSFTRTGCGVTGAIRVLGAPSTTSSWGWRSDPLLDDSIAFTFLNEDVERRQQCALRKGQAAHYLHVDDGLLITSAGDGAAASTAAMHQVADAWESAGFVVDERREPVELDKVVGYAVTRQPPELRLPANRLQELYVRLTFLMLAQVVDRALLEATLGVWVWGAILRRELLSVPRSVYHQLDRDDGGPTLRLWASTRRELRAMRDLLPLMAMRPGSKPGPWIFATDARGERDRDAGAFGIVVSPASADEQETIFRLSRCVAYTVGHVDGDDSRLRRPEDYSFRTIPRSRLPNCITEQERWTPAGHGLWRYHDHINLGEMRVVVRLLRKLGCRPAWHGRMVISLEDNAATVGAFTKGRSPAARVLHLCRQYAAISLACCFRVLLPWVESKRQPGDSVSRL